MCDLGLQHLTKEQVDLLFDETDTTGDGKIAPDEFRHLVQECLNGDSSSSSSSESGTDYSFFSTDSQALQQHPLILQVQAKEGKVVGKPPKEGFFPYLQVK